MRTIDDGECMRVIVRAPDLLRHSHSVRVESARVCKPCVARLLCLIGCMLVALLWFAFGLAPTARAAGGAMAEATLVDLLRNEDLSVSGALRRATNPPTRAQLRRFAEALRVLADCREHPDARAFEQVRGLLRSVNYEILPTADGYWLLRDRLRTRGMGSYAVSRAPRDRLLVVAPKAFDEAYAAQAATALFHASGAQALAIAGAAEPGGHDAPAAHATFFHLFHRAYVRDDVLAVRGVAREVARQSAWMSVGSSRLWVNRQPLSTSLSVDRLKTRIGVLVVIGRGTPGADLRRDETPGAYIVLQLNRDDAAGLAVSLDAQVAVPAPWPEHVERGVLTDWLQADIARAAAQSVQGVSGTRPAGFNREVLGPLVQLAQTGHVQGRWSQGALQQLRALHYVAGGAGYGVMRLRESKGHGEYIILYPMRAAAGSVRYVLRVGGGDDYAVKIPKFAAEPHALEHGVRIFRALGARALIVGDDAQALAWLRPGGTNGIEPAFMTVVSRALPAAQTPDAGVLLGFADGTATRERASPLGERLLSVMRRAGYACRLIDARAPAQPAAFGEVATLWFMPQLSARGAAPGGQGG